MRKKIISIIFFFVIASVVGYNVYTSLNNINLSELVLVNVDALAQQEESGGLKVYCYGNTGTCMKVSDSNGDYVLAGILTLVQ